MRVKVTSMRVCRGSIKPLVRKPSPRMYHPPKSHSPILRIAFCFLWMRVCCRRGVTCVLRTALDACAFSSVWCVVLLVE